MACAEIVRECLETDLLNLERVRYFQRQLLTAQDMIADQDYFREKLRRHNRFLHGCGIVCGLEVTSAPLPGQPLRVSVSPGYALAGTGDEIYVSEPVFLDLAVCGPGAATDPCEPGRVRPGQGRFGGQIYLAICYAECFARPVRSLPGGCGCDETACEYSRVRDSFQLTCLDELPASPPRQSICASRAAIWKCPPCTDDACVVLARISGGLNATGLTIDNTVRRPLFSTSAIQDQVIDCCCGDTPTQPPDNPPAQQFADLVVDQSFEFRESNVRITVTVTNLGPSPANNVHLEDAFLVTGNLPAPIVLTAFNFSAQWTSTPPHGPLVADFPAPLAPGAVVTLSFDLRDAAQLGPSFRIRNTAKAGSTTADPNLANNTSTNEFNA
jgi:hypothetical protein